MSKPSRVSEFTPSFYTFVSNPVISLRAQLHAARQQRRRLVSGQGPDCLDSSTPRKWFLSDLT